jgi:hypothetical protein
MTSVTVISVPVWSTSHRAAAAMAAALPEVTEGDRHGHRTWFVGKNWIIYWKTR